MRIIQIVPAIGICVVFRRDGKLDCGNLDLWALDAEGNVNPLWYSDGKIVDPRTESNFVGLLGPEVPGTEELEDVFGEDDADVAGDAGDADTGGDAEAGDDAGARAFVADVQYRAAWWRQEGADNDWGMKKCLDGLARDILELIDYGQDAVPAMKLVPVVTDKPINDGEVCLAALYDEIK